MLELAKEAVMEALFKFFLNLPAVSEKADI